MRSLLLATTIVAFAGSAFAQAGTSSTRDATPRACDIALDSFPIRLPGGERVLVDVSALAGDGSRILAIGTTTVWSRGGASKTFPASDARAIGVLTDLQGHAELLPLPIDRKIDHPRVVYAGNGVWDVLFFTGRQGARLSVLAHDTATAWHARFADGAWRDVRPVARIRGGTLWASIASSLVRAGNELRFAYPFDLANSDSAALGGPRGIVMLRKVGSAWREDTLRWITEPRSVELTGSSSASTVLFSARYTSGTYVPWVSIHRATFDGAWRTPMVLASTPPVHAVMVAARDDGGVTTVAWRTNAGLDVPDTLRLLRFAPDGRALRGMSLGAVDEFMLPALGAAPGGGSLVVAPDRSTRSLRAFFLGDAEVTPVRQLAAPVSLPRLRSLDLDDQRVALWTNAEGADPSERLPASYLVLMRPRCDSTRERRDSHTSSGRGLSHAVPSNPGSIRTSHPERRDRLLGQR